MTGNLRADIEALIRGTQAALDEDGSRVHPVHRDTSEYWIRHLRAILAAHPAEESGDEHHTMDELYEYRMLYNAHAVLGWLASGVPVVKSLYHSDGEPCFGGGWFIVTAMLPTGQVSNHYRTEFWDLFDVPAVPIAPTWDGHTPAVAANRLRAALGVEVNDRG